MKKKLFVLFVLMLFLSNPALTRASFSKERSVIKEKGNVAAVWEFITSTSDRSVEVFYKIENSELVFKFINLNHDKKIKIWYQFRCEGKIGYEEKSFAFMSSIIVNEDGIEYSRWNITGRMGFARIPLFKILSVEFLKND